MKETTTVVTAAETTMGSLVAGLKKSGFQDAAIIELITSESADNEAIVNNLKESGYSDSAILKLLSSASKKPESQPEEKNGKILVSDKELMERVTEIMHQIGVPAHIKGYNYLREAIVLAVKDTAIINSVTKILYPTIAKEFATTSSRVERAIRHAIEVGWDRGDVDVLRNYFGYTIQSSRGKPTNSEFIAMISDKLKMKYIVE